MKEEKVQHTVAIQVYLPDTVGSVPDHCHKANSTVKRVE